VFAPVSLRTRNAAGEGHECVMKNQHVDCGEPAGSEAETPAQHEEWHFGLEREGRGRVRVL
jgi:hypothetical protein